MISRRGNRWRVVVQGGRDPVTQRRRQLSGSAATKPEALKLESCLLREVMAGLDTDITVRRLVAEWWASEPRLAPTTKTNYRENLDRHVLPIIGDRKVIELRPRLISALMAHLATERGLIPGTRRSTPPLRARGINRRRTSERLLAWATARTVEAALWHTALSEHDEGRETMEWARVFADLAAL